MNSLVRGMNVAGTAMVLVIMAVILADVAGRALFARPLPGTPEIVAMSIAVIVFLQFPSTLRAHRVIAAAGLLGLLGARRPRLHRTVLALHHAAGAAMFAVVCRFVVPKVAEAWQSADYYGSLSVFTFPKWPVFAVIAFGCATMALQYALLAAEHARGAWRGEPSAGPAPDGRALG